MILKILTGWLLAAALAAPAPAQAPWTRILDGLRQRERSQLAARALLGDCAQDCYTRYNEHLIQCYGLPQGSQRVLCLSQAQAEFDACAERCEGR